MLVLSAKPKERFLVGDNIWITVVRSSKGRVQLGFDCPQEVNVSRQGKQSKDDTHGAIQRDLEPAGTPGTEV